MYIKTLNTINVKTTTMKLLLVMLTLFIGQASYSQTYDVYIANEALTSNTTMEFDVYIKSNGATGNWALRSYQCGYQFSSAFVNGGTLSGSYVISSSELEANFGKTWGFTYSATPRVV